MKLRGYDDYPVTLGDEMRGQRASLGKTLLDAEYDLRIKAHQLRAIEDCDLEGFPNMSVVPGYVRSYARYLGMDADETYRRFCAESGYRSPTAGLGAGLGGPAGREGGAGTAGSGAARGTDLTRSRFAMRPAPARLGTRVSLGALTSALALVALIAGLGYGGYALLQDLQRVGFAPASLAPAAFAEASLIAPPAVGRVPVDRAGAPGSDWEHVFAASASVGLRPPEMPTRDGPISAIDPESSGLFAPSRVRDSAAETPKRADRPETAGRRGEADTPRTAVAGIASPDGPNGGQRVRLSPAEAALAEPVLASLKAGPPKVVLQATDEAWVRVRDGEAVIFEGILPPGGQYEIPERVAAPLLRAGNAGALYVLVDDRPYGPVGDSAVVLKNMSLLPGDIAGHVPQATAEAILTGPDGETLRRAEADVAQ